MSRFIWCLAGLSMALDAVADAAEGPSGYLAHVDPTAWTIVLLGGAAGWAWLAIGAARGRF